MDAQKTEVLECSSGRGMRKLLVSSMTINARKPDRIVGAQMASQYSIIKTMRRLKLYPAKRKSRQNTYSAHASIVKTS